MSIRRALVVTALVASVAAGCGDDDGDTPAAATTAAAPVTTAAVTAEETTTAQTTAADTTAEEATSGAVAETTASEATSAEPTLEPPVEPLEDVGALSIGSESSVDWTLVAFDHVWISGIEGGVGVFDVADGSLVHSIEIAEGPCGAMDAGFKSVWTRTCDTPGVTRVSQQGKVVEQIPLGGGRDGETSIGVGEGGVWVVDEGLTCSGCLVSRIDPATNAVTDRIEIPGGATAVRAGLGGVWVTSADTGQVLRIDPESRTVVATVELAPGVRFFDVGEGAVWVLNAEDGTVARIDPATNEVAATIPVEPYVEGGDLTVGGGFVWVRGSAELVAQIDPATNTVVRRFGEPKGSGSASAGTDWLWATAHDVALIYRIPLTTP